LGIRRWCNGILSFFLSVSRAYARSWPRWTAAQLAIPLHFRRTWSLEQSRPTFLAHSPFSWLLCPLLALLLARSNSHGHRPSTPSVAAVLPPYTCARAAVLPPYTRARAASASGSLGHCTGAAAGTAPWPPRAHVAKKPRAHSGWAEAAHGRGLMPRSRSASLAAAAAG